MNILLWILFGGLSGWFASLIMKSDNSQGTLGDIILGILGAVVGGFIMNFIGQPGVTGFNLYSMIVAVLGSVILLFLRYSVFKR